MSRAISSLQAMLDSQDPSKKDSARSAQAVEVAEDPAQDKDRYGPRSPFLRRLDMKAEGINPLTEAKTVPKDQRKVASQRVDAINATKERWRQTRGY